MTKKRIKKKFIKRKKQKSRKKIIPNEFKFNSNYNNFIDFNSIISWYKEKILKTNLEKYDNINFSFINMINNYLKDCSCLKNKDFEFIQNFYEIIRILSLDENEFVLWTLLIDIYVNKIQDKLNLKNLFYLAICAKKELSKNFKINKNIKNDFNIWISKHKKIVNKKISLQKFNERYCKLNYLKNFQTKEFLNVDLLINKFIDLNNKKRNKIKNKEKKKKFIVFKPNEINKNFFVNNINIINNLDKNNVNININNNKNQNNINNNCNNCNNSSIKNIKKDDNLLNNNMNSSYNNINNLNHLNNQEDNERALSSNLYDENRYFNDSIEGIEHYEDLFDNNYFYFKKEVFNYDINNFEKPNNFCNYKIEKGNDSKESKSQNKEEDFKSKNAHKKEKSDINDKSSPQ